MNDWKPKDLDEALDDAIGSALNDNAFCPEGGRREILDEGAFDKVIKEAIWNIKNIKGLKMIWEVEE